MIGVLPRSQIKGINIERGEEESEQMSLASSSLSSVGHVSLFVQSYGCLLFIECQHLNTSFPWVFVSSFLKSLINTKVTWDFFFFCIFSLVCCLLYSANHEPYMTEEKALHFISSLLMDRYSLLVLKSAWLLCNLYYGQPAFSEGYEIIVAHRPMMLNWNFYTCYDTICF